jgi:hypothetical protein
VEEDRQIGVVHHIPKRSQVRMVDRFALGSSGQTAATQGSFLSRFTSLTGMIIGPTTPKRARVLCPRNGGSAPSVQEADAMRGDPVLRRVAHQRKNCGVCRSAFEREAAVIRPIPLYPTYP